MATGKTDKLNTVAVDALIRPKIPVFHNPTFKAILTPAASPYPAAPIPDGAAESIMG